GWAGNHIKRTALARERARNIFNVVAPYTDMVAGAKLNFTDCLAIDRRPRARAQVANESLAFPLKDHRMRRRNRLVGQRQVRRFSFSDQNDPLIDLEGSWQVIDLKRGGHGVQLGLRPRAGPAILKRESPDGDRRAVFQNN